MKKLLLLFTLAVVVASCKKELNQINVVFPDDMELGTHVHDLIISSEDTIIKIVRGKRSAFFTKGDTLTFSGLRSGDYAMSYLDLLGKTKIEKITLKGGDTLFVVPKPLKVDVTSFYDKTPINSLKEGEQYCVVKSQTWSTCYTVYKIDGKVYFEPYAQEKKILNDKQINYIRQFEAELFAIKGIYISYSSGSAVYRIIKNGDTLRIDDNTCMWNRWVSFKSLDIE